MKRDLLKGIVSVYYATLPSNIGDLKNFNSLRSREIDLCTNAKLKLQKYQVWQLLTYAVKDVFGIVVFAIMLVLMTFTETSPVLLVVLSAVCGIICKSLQERSKDKTEKGGNKQ